MALVQTPLDTSIPLGTSAGGPAVREIQLVPPTALPSVVIGQSARTGEVGIAVSGYQPVMQQVVSIANVDGKVVDMDAASRDAIIIQLLTEIRMELRIANYLQADELQNDVFDLDKEFRNDPYFADLDISAVGNRGGSGKG